MNLRKSLQLYFVMGSLNCENHPAQVLEEALSGGITMFQFREKGPFCLEGEKRVEMAKEFQRLCHYYGIPFIVNDDVELALSMNADGVHIGQEDGNVETIRKKIGSKILGVSAHNLREARIATSFGADYLGVGPMFPTFTKKDCRKVKGPRVIKSIRTGGITTPLVGIGGIHPGNAYQVLEAGADGVAVISAISKHPGQTKRLAQSIRLGD
ncbi:MAG: thiamine phosphate synthase [Bacillota bacterium]